MPKASKQKKRVNKSSWIRDQPKALSAKELVMKAKAAGIELTTAYVYSVRSAAKRKGAHGGVRGPARRSGSDGAGRLHDVPRQQFLLLALRLGTDEAQRLLDGIAQAPANAVRDRGGLRLVA